MLIERKSTLRNVVFEMSPLFKTVMTRVDKKVSNYILR